MQTFFNTIPPTTFETIGVFGFALYVFNYMALTFHKITSHSPAYFVLNLLAAMLVLIGLTHSFNLASALIQMFWIVISIAAIVVRMRKSVVFRTQRTRSAAI